jgi:hypothetical protein
MKKRVIVWGTGTFAKHYYLLRVFWSNDFEIIAFTDNNASKWNTKFDKYDILPPEKALNLEYESILILIQLYEDVLIQLEKEFNVDRNKIVTYQDLHNNLCDRIIEKYKHSDDIEIKKVLEYYKNNGFNVFGYYGVDENVRYFVERDSEGWSYIIFEGKRMYFPKDYTFRSYAGRECLGNILKEQGEHSPHRYITNIDDIKQGSIIVDAGVCEGNFALRYIDKVKKAYLIESDPSWMGALEKTFKPYKDKIVLCNKYLTRYDSSSTVTLDTLVQEKIDFLKMDIEGAELDALLGGKRLLQKSDARCSICSYHKQNDAENISWILKNLGYQTSTSEGYMFFVYDFAICDSMDLRKGLIYACKE